MAANEKDLIRLTKDFYHTVNKNKLDEIGGFFADNVELVDKSSGKVYRGPQEAASFYRNSLAAFPDLKVDIDQQVATGNTVVSVITLKGTQKGPILTPDGGSIPATGKKVDYKCCEVWEFQGDKVTGVHMYADGLTIMQQLGIAPQPEAHITTERIDRRGTDIPRPTI